MFSKSGIMAQELKEQLGDRMPIAMRALEKSTGKAAKELFKMMEQGELGAEYIVPFAKALGEIADKGDAVSKAIETARIQKGRFINQVKQAGSNVFMNGFEEGLKELYGEVADQLATTGKSQKDLGNIYNKFFKLIKAGVKVITPLLEALIQVVSKGVDVLELSAKGWGKIYDVFQKLPAPIKTVTGAMLALGLAMKSIYAKGVAIVGIFQEIASYFDDELVGALEKKLGKQINIATGTTSEIVVTEEGVFKPEDYQQNVGIDIKALKNFEDLQKFMEVNRLSMKSLAEQMNITEEQLLKTLGKDGVTEEVKAALHTVALRSNLSSEAIEKLGAPLEKWVEGLRNGTIETDAFKDAVKAATSGELDLVEVLTSPSGMIAAATAAAASLWAIGALISLGKKGAGFFGKIKDIFKKTPKTDSPKPPKTVDRVTKNQGGVKHKTVSPQELLKRGVKKSLVFGAKTLAKGTLPLHALKPTMMGDGTIPPEELAEMMAQSKGNIYGFQDSGNSILNQLNAPNLPMSPMLTPQAIPTQASSVTNIFEGMDMQVNIAGDLPIQEARQAGQELADSFIGGLEAHLKRGR